MKYTIANRTARIFQVYDSKLDRYEDRFIRRIIALKDFGTVKAGDVGGWIENPENLSQDGDCWIYHDSVVVGSSYVRQNAIVSHDSIVDDGTAIAGNARVIASKIYRQSLITDTARLVQSTVTAHLCMEDQSEIECCSIMKRYSIDKNNRIYRICINNEEIPAASQLANKTDLSNSKKEEQDDDIKTPIAKNETAPSTPCGTPKNAALPIPANSLKPLVVTQAAQAAFNGQEK